MTAVRTPPSTPVEPDAPTSAFEVHLDVFTGPFDLLLGLIAKHRLDVTEVALAEVTDEFLTHIRAMQHWDLDEVTGFVLVAATLLDLKSARLLPGARSRTSRTSPCSRPATCCSRGCCSTGPSGRRRPTSSGGWTRFAGRHPRRRGDDPAAADLLPDLVWTSDPATFARVAAEALRPRPVPTVGLDHLHAPEVSVAEQKAVLVQRLAGGRAVSFRTLVADADGRPTVVARFLAVLDLYREEVVALEQAGPLAELGVRLDPPRRAAPARPRTRPRRPRRPRHPPSEETR